VVSSRSMASIDTTAGCSTIHAVSLVGAETARQSHVRTAEIM
jgi:hypothetical protein